MSLWVAGDDVYILCSVRASDAFKSVFFDYYSKDTKAKEHGLGQCAKVIQTMDYKDVDFLSKTSIYTTKPHFMRRQDKAALGSIVTQMIDQASSHRK